MPRPPALIVAGQAFHGLAYVFFIIAGQMFAGSVAPEGAGASMQALVFTAQTGVGLFLGTQFAGIVMDKCRVDGQVPVAEALDGARCRHAGLRARPGAAVERDCLSRPIRR